jgi:hypothetical protein
MADLTTQAGLETYRDELYVIRQTMSKAAGRWSLEGASYDRREAFKTLREEITWVNIQIAAMASSNSQEPVRMGIDTDDLSD